MEKFISFPISVDCPGWLSPPPQQPTTQPQPPPPMPSPQPHQAFINSLILFACLFITSLQPGCCVWPRSHLFDLATSPANPLPVLSLYPVNFLHRLISPVSILLASLPVYAFMLPLSCQHPFLSLCVSWCVPSMHPYYLFLSVLTPVMAHFFHYPFFHSFDLYFFTLVLSYLFHPF